MVAIWIHLSKTNLLQTFLILAWITQNSHCVYNSDYVYREPYSRVKYYYLTLTEGPVQPDNYVQDGYLINGEFPGPTIFVNQYDMLVVTVENLMTVNTTIHFHGFHQHHTVDSDGVPHVTQDPIEPGQTFQYQIQIGAQTGTYVYHGHEKFDLVWIHGAVVIRDNPTVWGDLGDNYIYDQGYEYTLLLEEVYHIPLEEYYADIFYEGKTGPKAMSYPINGYSYGIWDDNNGIAPGYEVFTVIPGKTYRFRVINIADDTYFRFSIEGHSFKVVEMDGIICDYVWTDHLEINTGQRYSILVTMGTTLENFWIRSESMFGGPDNGRAILHYEGAPDPTPMRKQLFPDPTPFYLSTATSWILPQLTPNPQIFVSNSPGIYQVPRRETRRIFIDTFMQRVDGIQQIFINDYSYEPPSESFLTQVRAGDDIGGIERNVYEIFEGEVIDLVIQNRITPDPDDEGNCPEHPWHVHGHSFHVVANGLGTANPEQLDRIIRQNIERGPIQFRDVATVFSGEERGENTGVPGSGCGWMVLRFIADNPGMWLTHCHITDHMLMGMAFVLYEHNPSNPALLNE